MGLQVSRFPLNLFFFFKGVDIGDPLSKLGGPGMFMFLTKADYGKQEAQGSHGASSRACGQTTSSQVQDISYPSGSISTPEVYGSTSDNLQENNYYSPSTPYAVSKLAGDLHLLTL